MINDKNLKQEGGEKSINLQGQNVNIYNGISYSDAKEIFKDLFKSNFIQLKNEAAEIAQQRAEEITDKFLTNLNEKSPESFDELKKPAMQDALFTAQKEYAKSGDSDLGDLLVDILVERAQTQSRNMLQLVLDESLKIAPSLTVAQLDTLTLNFLLLRTLSTGIKNFKDLEAMVKRDIEPFVKNLLTDQNQYKYLEFHRCGHLRMVGHEDFEATWLKSYKGLFSKGLDKESLKTIIENFDQYSELINPCIHDNSLLQVSVMNDTVLKKEMERLEVDEKIKPKLKKAFDQGTMNTKEARELLIKTIPCLQKVFDANINSRFKRFELSSVGIAIAHANFRRRTGQTLDVSIWIN